MVKIWDLLGADLAHEIWFEIPLDHAMIAVAVWGCNLMTSVDVTGLVLFQRLDEQDFDEKKEINRQKRLILQGKVRICEFFL